MNKILITVSVIALASMIITGIALTKPVNIKVESPDIGALVGPDIMSPYLNVGGLKMNYYSMDMKAATGTPCYFQSPVATSTLIYAGAKFTSMSTTTSNVLVWAKSATSNATTTALGSAITLAAGSQVTFLASTTPLSQTDIPSIFKPSQWLVLGVQGTQSSMTPTGTCKALFISQ